MKKIIERITSRSEKDTEKFAFDLAQRLPLGSMLTLQGDLGAGKTVFARRAAMSLSSHHFFYNCFDSFTVGVYDSGNSAHITSLWYHKNQIMFRHLKYYKKIVFSSRLILEIPI